MTQFYFSAAFGCIFAASLVKSLLGPDGSPITGIFFALGGLFLLLGAISYVRNRRARRAALKFIKSQASVFGRKRAQLVPRNDYGLEVTGQWEKEKSYIFSKVIPDHLTKAGHSRSAIGSLNYSSGSARPILAAIESAALKEAGHDPTIAFSDVASGIDYEQFCAGMRV